MGKVTKKTPNTMAAGTSNAGNLDDLANDQEIVLYKNLAKFILNLVPDNKEAFAKITNIHIFIQEKE